MADLQCLQVIVGRKLNGRETLSPPIFYTVLIAAGAVLPKKAVRLKVRMKGPIMTPSIREDTRAICPPTSAPNVHGHPRDGQ